MKRRSKSVACFMVVIAMILVLVGCGVETKEGTYTGKATGYVGEISVIAGIDQDGKILNIYVDKQTETKGIGTKAIEIIPQEIVDTQSLDVDVVSGATFTSKGVINAVADALVQAGKKPEDYGFAR